MIRRPIPLIALAVLVAAAPARGAFVTASPAVTGSRTITGPTTGLDNLFATALDPALNYVQTGELKFGVAALGLPAGATIQSATLSLGYAGALASSAGPAGSASYTLAGFTSGTTQASLNDFVGPSTAIASATALAGLNTGTQAFDVTAFLIQALGSSPVAVGFRLDPTAGRVFFAQPDAADPAYRPTLSIVYAAPVPEPASAAMLAAGLVGLGLAARRR